MKILIAYDGSPCSESCLDDLATAGLPAEGEAVVITVAETWVQPPSNASRDSVASDHYLDCITAEHQRKAERRLNQAEMMAKYASDRVRAMLPNWSISYKAAYGKPAREIIGTANELSSNLIMVGVQGHSLLTRLALGSVSQKVLFGSRCNVRVARGRVETDPPNCRILIGFDGSRGAESAVDIVASREWAPGTEIKLLCAAESQIPVSIGRFTSPSGPVKNDPEPDHWIIPLAEAARSRLNAAGLSATFEIERGDPRRLLLSQAEGWHADSLFVGANTSGTFLDRFLLGTTAAALASRAICSVEVVRTS